MNRRQALKGIAAISVASLAPFDAQSLETTVETWDKLADGWHHYAVSRCKGETRYYVDGKEVGSVTRDVASFHGSSDMWSQHWGILDDMEAAMPAGDWCVSGDGFGELVDGLLLQPMT